MFLVKHDACFSRDQLIVFVFRFALHPNKKWNRSRLYPGVDASYKRQARSLRASVQTFIMVTSSQFSPSLTAVLMQIRSIIWSLWISVLMLVSRAQPKQTLTLDIHSEKQKERSDRMTTPSSVNYHFTRQCNYKCGFCFHTAKTSFVLPIEEAKRGLHLLKQAGNGTFHFLNLTFLFSWN